MIVPSTGGVRDARRAVGVVVAAGCTGEGCVSSAFRRRHRCAVREKGRGASFARLIARRSRARAREEAAGSGRTLHGDERGAERRERQRLSARHTREHHRAPAREKSTARRGCVRRAAVPFPVIRDARSTVESASSKRSNRSGFAPDAGVRAWARSCGGGCGRRSDVSSTKHKRFFRLPGSPAPGSRDRLFFMVHEPCARRLSERRPKRCKIGIPFLDARAHLFPCHSARAEASPRVPETSAFRAASRARSVCATPTHR